MAKRAITPAIIPKTYPELRDAVLAVVVEGRRAIDRAWVESYHEVGRLIHEYQLFKQERAAYGAGVFAKLAEESGISSRTLHECVQFFRCYPIVRGRAQLGWAQYRLLCQIDDADQQAALTKEAEKQRLKTPQLEQRVRALNAAIDIVANPGGPASAKPAHQPLVPQRGTAGLHLIVDRGDGPVVDLGFKLYRPLTAEQAQRFAKGDIVRLGERLTRADGASKAELFTYAATLRRVVDGDTLVVALEVAPEIFIEQKLRLRGLDCPEMSTAEGKAAKRFVEALVVKTTAIVINTTKPDKYDRYLADVFLQTEAAGEIFLNNTLLESGQAVRKDAWEFGDWEPELVR
jgi:endonuclease YncB( thermonuclease family)